ncbi:MAG: hypothetical protein Q9228_007804, partial [Teloschistes exilis]
RTTPTHLPLSNAELFTYPEAPQSDTGHIGHLAKLEESSAPAGECGLPHRFLLASLCHCWSSML